MDDALDRRAFLKVAGLGSASAAGFAAMPLLTRVQSESNELTFRAATGLPRVPLPSYATHIVEGSVDTSNGSGLITSRVLAGHPGDTSSIGLPGLARVIRVTAADTRGQQLRLRGVIEDRSQLRHDESSTVEIVVDKKRGVVHAPFLGRQIELQLANR